MPAPRPIRMPPECGAAAIETTLSLLLMMLLATAILEFSYWGVVRQLCKLALHESMRIAVAKHGTQHALEQAFVSVRHSRLTEPWSLRIVEPDTNTLMDFRDPFLSAQHGQAVIRNDSQREQHQRLSSQWPGGLGPTSGKTIYQANVILVELTYQHRLISPWFRRWLRSANTRVTHQAAMQSDFHASRSTRQMQAMVAAVDRLPRLVQGSHHGQHHKDKQNHKQNLMTWPQSSSTADSLANEDDFALLHPDLAEQCRSLMCCISP